MQEIATRPTLFARLKAGIMGIGPWNSRPGPPSAPAAYTDEGWIPLGWPTNFGQLGYDPLASSWNPVVYSCIMLYGRTIAQLPGRHLKVLPDNGTEQITNSALSRILQRPNDYQTRSAFMINMVSELLGEGNGYALALRNDRYEVTELHQLPSRSTRALYAVTGEVFYSIGGNPILDYRMDPSFHDGTRYIVPARDILHFCGPSKASDPLRGESPLIAGGLPISVSSGGNVHFSRFYQNMSRPSGTLSTDVVLTADQTRELRQRWEEHSKGMGMGGVPVLSAGLKWTPMALTASDMQIAESMKMSKQDIAMIFGVPLALINDMEGATWNNTENLILMWLRQGLGFYVDSIELAFDKLFQIERGSEYTYLDIDEALLRPDFKNRIEGLARGVQGGIYAPNEARKIEGLPKAEDGDEPRLQQQMVPLTAWDKAPPTPPKLPQAESGPPADNAPEPDKPADDEKDYLPTFIKALEEHSHVD
jgi:HK97 family phage portal protein